MIITKAEISILCRPCESESAESIIRETEMLDIAPQIGQKLFEVVDSTPSDFTDLLNGCSFTDNNGNKQFQQGLKKCLAYYASARIIRSSNGIMTRYGYVVKMGESSSPAEMQRVANDSNYLREVASQMMEQIKVYIQAMSATELFKNYIQEDELPSNGGFIQCDLIGD